VGTVLGKLYDGIDCHGLPPEVVSQLERHAGRPVFQAGACGSSRAALGRYTMQALLLTVLG
jgi:ornithine carbamoyltransferase